MLVTNGHHVLHGRTESLQSVTNDDELFMKASHHALDTKLVCLELCYMIRRAGHIPYLHAGLVPVLEWNRDGKPVCE